MAETVSFLLKFEVLRDGIPLPGWEGYTNLLVISSEMLEGLYNPEHYVNSQLVTLLQQKLDEIATQKGEVKKDE